MDDYITLVGDQLALSLDTRGRWRAFYRVFRVLRRHFKDNPHTSDPVSLLAVFPPDTEMGQWYRRMSYNPPDKLTWPRFFRTESTRKRLQRKRATDRRWWEITKEAILG